MLSVIPGRAEGATGDSKQTKTARGTPRAVFSFTAKI
jgi:hypothetical protein